jgi:hypothetical protein
MNTVLMKHKMLNILFWLCFFLAMCMCLGIVGHDTFCVGLIYFASAFVVIGCAFLIIISFKPGQWYLMGIALVFLFLLVVNFIMADYGHIIWPE